MTQSPDQPDDTSDRLYTPEELRAFAAAEAADADPGQEAAAVAPPAHRPEPLGSPLRDPLSDPMPGVPPAQPAFPPVSPPVSSPPATPVATPPAAPPASPPAAPRSTPPGPPPAYRPSGPPPGARPTGPPPTAAPTAPAPAAPAATQHSASMPPASPAAPAAPGQADPRRFMSATDFLERRTDVVEQGPASWGWRGRVRRWSGGLIKPKMGPAELAYESDRSVIQRDFEGPKTIAFINPKGGAAKTTSVLVAGYTFGTVRGGGVFQPDKNAQS